MGRYPEMVIDEVGVVHRLEPVPLGEGGQGVVIRTLSNPAIAVKLLLDGAPDRLGDRAADPGRSLAARLHHGSLRPVASGHQVRSGLVRRLERLRTLPLAEDLQLARPLTLLRDLPGYTMRLLRGMVPMLRLIATPEVGDLGRYYRETGGLRRRLTLLARSAGLLGRLHSVPLVYGDVSPSNLFISEHPEEREVWLIDPDNLEFVSQVTASIFTPGFGAPELVRNSTAGQPRLGATTLSDAYSFAVLAIWVLTQQHPFLGERVEVAGWDASVPGPDPEQQAFAGELPWILDPEDDSNRSASGIQPAGLVLSEQLMELFRRTFGPGRRDPAVRPGLPEWCETLHRAADHALGCPACGATYYLDRRCPWCRESPPARFLEIVAFRPDPAAVAPDGETVPSDLSLRRVGRLLLDPHGTRIVPQRLVAPVGFAELDQPALEVTTSPRGVRVRALDARRYLLRQVGQPRPVPLAGEQTLPLPRAGTEWSLHCGPPELPHRLLAFRLVGEVG